MPSLPLPPRLHLFELEDQGWLPSTLRELATDYLATIESRLGLGAMIGRKLDAVCQRSGLESCVDLGSGSGGVWPDILASVASSRPSFQAVLSDRYPNLVRWHALEKASDGRIRHICQSVDARNPPSAPAGIRTLCNVLHHFEPEEVRGLLQAVARTGHPIAVFEVVDRRLSSVLGMLPVPLTVWLMTPTMRPFRWSRLLWTYLLPLVPALVLWDGLVSQLRAYTSCELEALARAAAPDYLWESGVEKLGGMPVRFTWLVGLPPTA